MPSLALGRRMVSGVLQLVLATLTGCGLLMAQSFTGAIVGNVTDPSGAAVVKVHIKVIEERSNVVTEADTDTRGAYAFPALRPGVYRIEAEAAGFRRLTQSGIEVHVGDKLELNLQMLLGALSESVEVTAAAPLVESQTGAIGNVIENRKIVDLPLNNRNPFQLALLSPGVVPSPAFGNAFNTSGNFLVNGNRGNTSEMLVDGITNSVPAANPIVVVSLSRRPMRWKSSRCRPMVTAPNSAAAEAAS